MGIIEYLVKTKSHKVIVDYDLTFSEMVKRCNFDTGVSDNLNEKNFIINGTGRHECELVLVHFREHNPTSKILEYMNEHGLEAARLEHLFALVPTFPIRPDPKSNQFFHIIVLGSIWKNDGNYYCPIVYVDWGLQLGLDCSAHDEGRHTQDRIWDPIPRFLAVRK